MPGKNDDSPKPEQGATMTGLHTRGYRPEPGERGLGRHSGPLRPRWESAWRHVREGGASWLGGLDIECLDAREQLDQLTERYAIRIARKAVAICGRLELLSTPEATSPWGPS